MWLTSGSDHWPTQSGNVSTDLEERRNILTFATQDEQSKSLLETLILRFSRLSRAERVIAYIFRWKERARLADHTRGPHPTALSAEELRRARLTLVRAVQQDYYAAELKCLKKAAGLPSTSALRNFLPFIDADGILRIGGRLQNAFLTESEKHPAIIPNESHLAELLVRDAHERTLHGGPQLVSSYLQRAYWVVKGRNRIRRLTNQCVRCTRFKGHRQSQQMDPLPAARVIPARPFTSTGLDYAGPFLLRTSEVRDQKAYKGYLAIFVCMVSRAIHLEVVSDYTAQGFLLAFRRFVSRRGLCTTIFNDNGTTFKGASAEIRDLFEAASCTGREIAAAVAADGVEWKFIPPRAPHFGGRWEAGVKAAKYHLRRVLGETKLTYEEFATLSTQIEACLNSRPLCPRSGDPADLAALTPEHFLIGAPLTALPEPSPPDFSVAGVPRYRLTSIIQAHFWKRWQGEVLRQHQQRSKWLQPNSAVREGDLVLLTDDLQPPSKWPLARVERCHPGADGLTRVLRLRTATTTLTRPLVRVIRLPVEQPTDTEPPTAGGLTSSAASTLPSAGGTESAAA